MNCIYMEDIECRSDDEQRAYEVELEEVESILKSLGADTKWELEAKLDPDTNYKLIYR